MNIGLIFKNAASAIRKVSGNGILLAKRYAPELMIGGGLAGFGVTIVGACKATSKAHEILERKEEALSNLGYYEDMSGVEYTEANLRKDTRTINRQTRRDLVRVYFPVVTGAIASGCLVLGGYHIINGRLVATAAAYKTLELGFENYRNNVVSEYGSDADWRMMNTYSDEDMQKALAERADNQDAKLDKKKRPFGKRKKPRTAYSHIYDFLFDANSARWRSYWTPIQVLEYAHQKEQELTDQCKIRGHLFGNEINDAFDIERTPEGQVCGILMTPERRNDPNWHVDLGLDDMPDEVVREILSSTRNEDIHVWIRPKLDGVIYQQIDLRN